jgi:DNA primase
MLAAQQLGERVTVVTLGSATNRLSRRLYEMLRTQKHIYTALDADEAGAEATARLARMLGKRHVPLALPSGKDITDYVVEHGGDLLGWFAVASGQLL